MRLCVLGSGSRGNCIYAGTEQSGILIDTGLSARRTLRGLEEIGVPPSRIRALCLSHEHRDHCQAVARLADELDLAVYVNAGTLQGLGLSDPAFLSRVKLFTTGASFAVDDMIVTPFAVLHDAYEPVGFTIVCGSARIGIATDLGMVTDSVREHLRGCEAIVLEANHDPEMLRASRRPRHLVQRILGRQGHLSNDGAAEALVSLESPSLRHVFLAHLSAECNTGRRARRVVLEALSRRGLGHVGVELTYPDRVSAVWCADLPADNNL
jgi:phosphoribosyl 1,2-cyclic phosphodiesterase